MRGPCDSRAVAQFRPVRMAQIRHAADGSCSPLIEPAKDLWGAILRPTELGDEAGHLRFVEGEQIDAGLRNHRARALHGAAYHIRVLCWQGWRDTVIYGRAVNDGRDVLPTVMRLCMCSL